MKKMIRQDVDAFPTIDENIPESSQDDSYTSQGDSTSKVRNGIKHPDEQSALRPVHSPSPSIAPQIEIDFKLLDDGRVVELVEDPTDATKAKLAVFDSGNVYLADEVDCGGQRLVPIERTTDGLEDVTLPRAPRLYQSAEEVFFRTFGLIEACVALPIQYTVVVAAFILHSWFADRLRPPVYLLLTGLPQSGKTTLLQVMQLVCRRPLLVSDITSAATNEACSRFGCTLLIDENDWRADPNSRALRKQLRSGTSKGLLAKRLGKTQHAFGAKVLSSVELPDDAALRSRCVHLTMNETIRTDLRKPWDPSVVKVADALRGQLLQFRLERYASISPQIISGAEKLRPRSRDLLGSLLAPLTGESDLEQTLLAFFLECHDPSTRDLLSPAQTAVVAALFEYIHLWPDAGYVQVGTVTELANGTLKEMGERLALSPRKCSDILASLGLGYRERSRRGSLRRLDKETVCKIHTLMRDHDVQPPMSLDLGATSCEYCEEKSTPTS